MKLCNNCQHEIDYNKLCDNCKNIVNNRILKFIRKNEIKMELERKQNREPEPIRDTK